jgi:NifU-like protein
MNSAHERIRRIARVLESLRPRLQADLGDVELVGVEDGTLYVHLTGACDGCMIAPLTVLGLQRRLREELGEPVRVVPIRRRSPVVATATPAPAAAT